MSDMTNEAKVGDGPLCDQMQAPKDDYVHCRRLPL